MLERNGNQKEEKENDALTSVSTLENEINKAERCKNKFMKNILTKLKEKEPIIALGLYIFLLISLYF